MVLLSRGGTSSLGLHLLGGATQFLVPLVFASLQGYCCSCSADDALLSFVGASSSQQQRTPVDCSLWSNCEKQSSQLVLRIVCHWYPTSYRLLVVLLLVIWLSHWAVMWLVPGSRAFISSLSSVVP